MVDVEAEDLAQDRRQLLSVALRVAAGAAVAQPEVEVAVRAEGELAAVVIGERLLAESTTTREDGSARSGSAAETR